MTSEFVLDMVAKAPEATKRLLLAYLFDELRTELRAHSLGIEHDALGWWIETERETVSADTLAEAVDAMAAEGA